MAFRRVVVDGSNIATEGRSVPSLSQLDGAVREFQREFPDAEVTVVVDASFGHRIDESERQAFEGAESHGEIVSPPAGAIGRGDAFLLRIAEKTGATVLSNDSFQEFHGEHEWLFSPSRLVGGKPVPGVGWIFTPRTPVRGPRSRVATQDAKRTRVRVGSKEASQPMPVPSAPPPRRGRRHGGPKEPKQAAGAVREAPAPADPKVRKAIAAATEEVVSPQGSSRGRRRRRGSGPPPQAVNDPLTFISFIAEHPLGRQVEGEVESFTSHGAFVRINDAQAYVPVSGLGDPPPRSARQVLRRGERRSFVLQALDPQRRGVELALPEFAHVAGSPSEETVEAEISEVTGTDEVAPEKVPATKRTGAAKARATKRTGAGKARQPAAELDGLAAAAASSGRAAGPTAGTKAAKAGGAPAAKAGAKAKAGGIKAKEGGVKAKAGRAKAPAAKAAQPAVSQAKAAKDKPAKGKPTKGKPTKGGSARDATSKAGPAKRAKKTGAAKRTGTATKTTTATTAKAAKTVKTVKKAKKATKGTTKAATSAARAKR